MTREEFSRMLVKARKECAKSVRDIVFLFKIMPQEVYRVESAKSSSSMNTYFKYMEAVGCVLCIAKGEQVYVVGNNGQLVEWEIAARGKISKRAFSKLIGCSERYIYEFESGTKDSMTVDKFLKIAEVTGYEIRLVKKEESYGE